MKPRPSQTMWMWLACLLASSAGCSGSSGGGSAQRGSPFAADGGGAAPAALEAGASVGDDAAPQAPQALLRVAHLSPDLPAIDVCVAPHGTGVFQGPLLATLEGAATSDEAGVDGGSEGGPDAAAPGLAFAQVSAYLSLDIGQYDVRVVAAGAASCDASVGAPDATALPTLEFDTNSTLLIAGDLLPAGSDPGLSLGIVPDDAVLSGGASSLRAVNAIPGVATLDFGLGSFASTWLPLFTGVPFATAGQQLGPGDGVVDAHGYVVLAPLSSQVMSARASAGATSDAAIASAVTTELGSITTVFAIGGKTGDPTYPAALLVCTDNQPSGGLLSDCSVAP